MIQSIQIPDQQCFLVTTHIKSLYTNVSLEGGLQAAEVFLNQRINYIVDLIEIFYHIYFFSVLFLISTTWCQSCAHGGKNAP